MTEQRKTEKQKQNQRHKMKKQSYKLIGREEGSDLKKWTDKFATLKDASRFIKARWQGPEYCDSTTEFHTDFATYELVGFTLSDIGSFDYSNGFRDFSFHDLPGAITVSPEEILNAPEKVNLPAEFFYEPGNGTRFEVVMMQQESGYIMVGLINFTSCYKFRIRTSAGYVEEKLRIKGSDADAISALINAQL